MVKLSDLQIELTKKVTKAINEVCLEKGLTNGEDLLYARYDMVRLDDGTPVLMEAELFEP